MSLPKISLISKLPATDLVVIGARNHDGKVHLVSSSQPRLAGLAEIEALASSLDITGAADSFTRVINPKNPAQIVGVVGLGSHPAEPNALRYAAGVATRKLAGEKSIAIDLGATTEEELTAIAVGAALGCYSFTTYRSKPEQKNSVASVAVVGIAKNSRALLEHVRSEVDAVSLVKDLVNTPPNDLYPATFVAAAKKAVTGLPINVKVWDEKALARDGFGGILAVGAGSSRPPRLMKLTYQPTKSRHTIALVGKGITFDSGGLSLKSGVNMVGMKYDMTGAATALAVIRAAAQQKIPVAITAWLCLAENMPSGTAQRPNDVIKILGGTTVEVLNTDAEGRLVLADGLVAASKEKPDLIVDIATLTGASIIALGHRYTGAMGDAAPINQLLEVSRQQGEFMWHMPIPEELRSMLNSDVADIANVKIGSTTAGMLVGATFLKDFIGKKSAKKDAETIPWIHLDVAGTSNNPGAAYGFTGTGPTGVVVRSLMRFAKDYRAS